MQTSACFGRHFPHRLYFAPSVSSAAIGAAAAKVRFVPHSRHSQPVPPCSRCTCSHPLLTFLFFLGVHCKPHPTRINAQQKPLPPKGEGLRILRMRSDVATISTLTNLVYQGGATSPLPIRKHPVPLLHPVLHHHRLAQQPDQQRTERIIGRMRCADQQVGHDPCALFQ